MKNNIKLSIFALSAIFIYNIEAMDMNIVVPQAVMNFINANQQKLSFDKQNLFNAFSEVSKKNKQYFLTKLELTIKLHQFMIENEIYTINEKYKKFCDVIHLTQLDEENDPSDLMELSKLSNLLVSYINILEVNKIAELNNKSVLEARIKFDFDLLKDLKEINN